MNKREIEVDAANLIAFLRSIREDRGAMANLRCLWTPARAPRAWPLLVRAGALENTSKRSIAGLYALHPQESETGNMGDVCRALAKDHSTFTLRFQRLLMCDREELVPQLRRLILAAKAHSIALDYRRLLIDLHYWGDNTKLRWAAAFWKDPEAKEANQ